MLSEFDVRVRQAINRQFVDNGITPNSASLAAGLDCDEAAINSSLVSLARDHRLLLYPGTSEIWVAHPFSGIPSGYWVEAGDRGWWGNCGFCSLGIAAMLEVESAIHCRAGSERAPIVIRVSPTRILPQHYRLHVPAPISHWHDNLIHTCGNVHYFASDANVDDWCRRHQVARGQTMSLPRAWRLARGWYGNYLDPDWWPRSNAETSDLLRKCGLEGPFWRLPL